MNRLAKTLYVLAFAALTAVTSVHYAMGRIDSEEVMLAIYGRAVITEFCQKSKVQQCAEASGWISHADYEIATNGDGIERQYLVIFNRPVMGSFLFAIFAIDKDGWIKVLTRGVHMGEKEGLIKIFKQEGDFAR